MTSNPGVSPRSLRPISASPHVGSCSNNGSQSDLVELTLSATRRRTACSKIPSVRQVLTNFGQQFAWAVGLGDVVVTASLPRTSRRGSRNILFGLAVTAVRRAPRSNAKPSIFPTSLLIRYIPTGREISRQSAQYSRCRYSKAMTYSAPRSNRRRQERSLCYFRANTAAASPCGHNQPKLSRSPAPPPPSKINA